MLRCFSFVQSLEASHGNASAKSILHLLLIDTTLITAVLYLITGSHYVLTIALGIVSMVFVLMWSPPPRHKTFFDDYRLEATSRAFGGGGFPKL